jgi:Sortase domain
MSRTVVRLFGRLDKLLMVGVLCMTASGLAIVTQLGGTRATALTIPRDAYAQPYTDNPSSPAVTSTVPATPSLPVRATVAASPTAKPPVCPVPTYRRIAGLAMGWPEIVVIKKLGVDARVEQAGLDHHGDMQVPVNACDVAWFKPGPAPGAPGDAVIDGHLDWTSGPSVFWNLDHLKRGDEIDVVRANGTTLRFFVSRLRDVPHTTLQSGLFSSTGPSTLSLYTCAGTWDPRAQTYTERLIVDATLGH